jgi:hypothetical protein
MTNSVFKQRKIALIFPLSHSTDVFLALVLLLYRDDVTKEMCTFLENWKKPGIALK